MKLNSLRINLDASEDGQFFPFEDGAQVKIAKWGNKRHTAFLKEIGKDYGLQIQTGTITEEKAEYIMAAQYEFIVRDLKGFTEDDGVTPIEYSPQLIIDLARNPQFEDFFKRVKEISKSDASYRAENIKRLGEALPTSSNGQ